jgi:hypothetical protein
LVGTAVGIAVGVGVGAGVGAVIIFAVMLLTLMLRLFASIFAPLTPNEITEMVCGPLLSCPVLQLNEYGGEEAIHVPSR